MATPRWLHDPAGTGVAAGLVVLGGVLIVQTGGMTPLGSVFPITVSVAMIVLGLILIARNVVLGLRGGSGTGEAEEATLRGSVPRRVLFFGAMIAWVALLPVLGFFVTSLLGVFAVMATAIHERPGRREGALLVLAGIVIVTGFYWVMREVLLIPLPGGLLF